MANPTSDLGARELAQPSHGPDWDLVVWAFVIPEMYAWHGEVEVLYHRSGWWCGRCGESFLAELQGAETVGAMLVEEWGAFVVYLAAGGKEGEVGGEGDVCVDLVAEFAGESEECGWHGSERWYDGRALVNCVRFAQRDSSSRIVMYGGFKSRTGDWD